MKKRNALIAILLVLAMIFSMAACSGKQDNPDSQTNPPATTEPDEDKADTPEPAENTDPVDNETPPAEDETQSAEDNADLNEQGTVVYAINCDTADGWVTDVGAGAYGPFEDVGMIDTEEKTEGTGSLYIACDKTAEIGAFLGPSAVFQWTGDAIDTGLDRENAAIRMSIYVSSPDVVGIASKIQIGSAGMPDVDNYEFILGNADDQSVCTHTDLLEAGWNDVTLKLSDAWKVGDPDLSAVNFIKFYSLIVPGASEVRIDNICFVNLEG